MADKTYTDFVEPAIDAAWLNDANRKTYGFTSVAHMITVQGLYDGQQVDLLNYYEGISGGGGPIYWDATSTETDDGCMVFQVSGVATGRWKRQDIGYWGEFDVRKGGVIGDAREVSDANITTGTNVLTSATANFTSDDVGKSVAVFNAGATTDSLFSVISGVTNSTTAALTNNAGTTVSGVTCQIGTDFTTKMHSIIDAVHSAGGGKIKAIGDFFFTTKVQLRADNVEYDFSSATFYGNNFSCLDDVTTTHKVDNVIGYGGSFNPIGDTNTFGGNVNYNGLAFVHCTNVRWHSPRVFARDGTRCISIQTSSGHGAAPYVNATNIRLYDIGCFGDGNTHDGLDITSDINGTDEIQDVYVQGYIEGCKRGLNNSPGSTTLRHLKINLDLTIKDPDTIGAVSKYNVDSNQNLKVIDALVDGIDIRGPESCEFDLSVTGSGATLNDAVVFVNNSADTTNQAKISIGYDNTNLWTRGLVPSLNDLSISAYIDGCTTGIAVSGFRTVWGPVVLKNCTTNIDDKNLATDYWAVPVIDLGAGANPVIVVHSNNRSGADNGDADKNLDVGADEPIQRWDTALTTTRYADLQTAGAFEGAEFHIIRTATGASNLGIRQDGGATIKNMATSTWSSWHFDGSNWKEKSFGSL